MLQHIRDKAQSWIAYAIIALLIIGLSTVVWDGFFSPDPEVAVAKVNGEKITLDEFQRAYQQQRTRLQNMLGGVDISQFIPDETEFKKTILKRLEEEELAYQTAVAAGYRVSDGLLAQQIHTFEVFQRDGQFDPALYQQWLSQNYMSAGAFEEMLRRDVIVQQYRLAVAATAWSTAQERDLLLKLQEQQRDVGYITVPVANYLADIVVSDEDAQAYYDANKSRYATPEKVSIAYLELALTELGKDISVEESKLRELYQERQSDFGVPDERRVSHILIEVAGDASEEEQSAAKEKAESLLQQLRDGGDFAALAREHSDDIGSANEGGDLGYMARETMMDPAFADAAFSLAKGGLSEPVKSAYGYHIIKLTGIKQGQVKGFDELRTQLEQEYRRSQAEDLFFEHGEMLANLTFENPDTLDVAAKELGLTINTTSLFTREQGVGIVADSKIRDIAFSEDVLLERNNSQPIELDGDRVIVLRLNEHQESVIRAFDEVKQQIVQQLSRERAQSKAEEQGQTLLKQLAEGGDIQALAQQHQLEWKHPAPFKRDAVDVAAEVMAKAFRMARPVEGKTVYDGLRMGTGDYAVIALFNVADGDLAAIEANAKETLKSQRDSYYGANELLGAVADMRRTAEIKEFPENL